MIKEQLFIKCIELLNQQLNKYKKEITTIKESIENEKAQSEEDNSGKSELLNEIEKYARYIETTENTKTNLKRIDISQKHETITNGSLVETENNYFFIAVALGKLELNDKKSYYSISTDAPIYQELKGKKAGESFVFNNIPYKILTVH